MINTELVAIEGKKAIDIFKAEGVESILNEIENKVSEFIPDVDTQSGRKEIASLAYKVSKSKTALDDMGKKLVSDWKKQSKIVDSSRKQLRDRLDLLRDKVRLPLTEWEAAEEKRIAKEKLDKEISEAFVLAIIENELHDRKKAIEAQELKLAQDAEKKRLAEIAEQQERERIENEERIKKEAEIKAKKDAEEAIEKERQASIRREAEAIAAKEKLEREHREALEKAEADKIAEIKAAELKVRQESEDRERERIKKETEQRLYSEKLAKNRAHMGKINREALECLIKFGLTEKQGKKLIAAIKKSEIKNISINY